ncbi:hypothetical protein [uncultured Draconibacterium sp.]|uniref:hypothetical protein n=1 Tax=uncultured Draconibacterium sp. TaxID=1573823 RepID=UPI0025E6A195|nr:hypothetical protein [uncultured Draconibacterium sp.]
MTTEDTLKRKKEIASNLVQEIQDIVQNAQVLQNHIGRLNSSVLKKDTEFKTNLTKLNRLKGTMDKSMRSFNEKKADLTKLLYDANRYYSSKYLPLKEKVEDPETGLKKTLELAQKAQKEISTVKDECSKKYDQIKTITTELKKEVTKLKHISREIEGILSHTKRSKSSIEAIKQRISDIEDKVKTAHSNIESELSSSKQKRRNIDKLNADSTKLYGMIEDYETKSKERLDSIEKIYNIAHKTGLSGEFENRRNQHEKAQRRWRKFVFGVSLVLLLSLFILYACQLWLNEWNLNSTVDINFYIRFLILSPLVYYLYFSTKQYNKERMLFEQYSFKTTLAMEINHHIELLIGLDRFTSQDDSERIMTFIMQSFDKIYAEPQKDQVKFKIKLAELEMKLEKKILDNLRVKFEKNPIEAKPNRQPK